MLNRLVRIVERPRLAGAPATRRDALRKAYRPFTALGTARAEQVARELGW